MFCVVFASRIMVSLCPSCCRCPCLYVWMHVRLRVVECVDTALANRILPLAAKNSNPSMHITCNVIGFWETKRRTPPPLSWRTHSTIHLSMLNGGRALNRTASHQGCLRQPRCRRYKHVTDAKKRFLFGERAAASLASWLMLKCSCVYALREFLKLWTKGRDHEKLLFASTNLQWRWWLNTFL